MSTGAHPTPRLYVKVAAWLAVVTGIEVLLSYIEMPPLIAILALTIAAVIKFVVVVGYFMHLKFDNRILRVPFITGIFLALSIYTIVLANMILHSRGAG